MNKPIKERLAFQDQDVIDYILQEIQRITGINPEELGLSKEELSGRLLSVNRRRQFKQKDTK